MSVTSTGWSATVEQAGVSTACYVAMGSAERVLPGQVEGVPACIAQALPPATASAEPIIQVR